jgi:hypothetical protein
MVNPAAVEPIKAGMRFEFARTSVPDGFPSLPRIPGGRYTHPDFLALGRPIRLEEVVAVRLPHR